MSSKLLTRNQRAVLDGQDMGEPSGSLPASTLFNPYRPVTARNLVHLLFWLHARQGRTPHLYFGAHLPQAKALLEEVGPEKAERAVLAAAAQAQHSFTFKFVREFLER
jgi:hypothetical protein